MPVIQINEEGDVGKLAQNKVAIIHFYADWSDECKHMNIVFDELCKQTQYLDVVFLRCIAEDVPKLSLTYNVSAVPTFIILKNTKVVDTINGADPEAIEKKLQNHINSSSQNGIQPPESLDERLKKLINKHKIMIFMKGDRNTPRCGFSKTIIEIINETKLPYETFDILQDEEVRQGLKKYSDWPTYPQLYVKGELIGGLDILRDIKAANELEKTLNPAD